MQLSQHRREGVASIVTIKLWPLVDLQTVKVVLNFLVFIPLILNTHDWLAGQIVNILKISANRFSIMSAGPWSKDQQLC